MDNWVLIVLDTLRRDVFYECVAPKLDLAGFKEYYAVAPSFWTIPSHASMFTGLYPSQHGVRESSRQNWKPYSEMVLENPALLQTFTKDNYNTYGFSANLFVSPSYGYRGWNLYELFSPFAKYNEAELNEYMEVMRTTSNRASKFITLLLKKKYSLLFKELKDTVFSNKWKLFDPVEMGGAQIVRRLGGLKLEEPFFLFINLMEAHDPNYRGSNFIEDLTKSYVGKLGANRVTMFRKGYYKKADRLTEHLATILFFFNTMPCINRTNIIVTSDHGQLLGEGGLIGHSSLKFETSLVPLLVRHPDAKKCEGVVSLTRLHDFILYGAPLCSKVAYSEQFGVTMSKLYTHAVSEGEKRRVSELDRRFVEAVCSKGGVLLDVEAERVVEVLGGLGEREMQDLREQALSFANL
jgi:arylsulfatase A-like enzyme